MKNLLIIISLTVAAIVIGFGGFALLRNSDDLDSVTKNDNKTPEEVIIEKSDTETTKNDSRYVEYSNRVLDITSSNRRVLFFYANWCPTCRPADVNFKESTSMIPEDVTVIRVNYNDTETDQEEKDLAKQYGVTYQHTFIQIDAAGKEVTKWNGGQINELIANIK